MTAPAGFEGTETMSQPNLLQFTLDDGRAVLIRADLIEQVRQRDTGAEIWLSAAVVNVSESIEQVKNAATAR